MLASLRYLTIVTILLLGNNPASVVESFAPPPHPTATILSSSSSSSSTSQQVGRRTARIHPQKGIATSTTTKTTTALQSSPSPSNVVTWSIILGHVIGGTLGTPFVLKATKKPNGWYRQINLPSWTPPDRIFAPVWTTLYTCMGIAVTRILNVSSTTNKTAALSIWACHYILNILWAPVFFGMQRLRLGLIINGFLIATLLAVLKLFATMDITATYLLLPYLVWLLFATVLNYDICQKNPTVKGYNDAKFQAALKRLQMQAAKYADGGQ
eukprot:scaffold7603_cov71-Cylindrotheca_fusiformis.AAC.2